MLEGFRVFLKRHSDGKLIFFLLGLLLKVKSERTEIRTAARK